MTYIYIYLISQQSAKSNSRESRLKVSDAVHAVSPITMGDDDDDNDSKYNNNNKI